MTEPSVLCGPQFTRPVENISLGSFYFENAQKYGPSVCQIDATEDKSETYASVKLRSTRLAIAMQKKGISKDDVVATCSPNTLDNTLPIFAAAYLGAKISNLDCSLSARHTKHLLNLVTPKMIFVHESAIKLIEEGLVGATFKTEIIVFEKSKKYCSFSDMIKPQANEKAFRPVDVDLNDVAVLIFSSGTTGLPKAICHSHSSFLNIVNQMYDIGGRKAILNLSTMYAISGMGLLACSFNTGTYRVFARDPSPEDMFRIIEKYKIEYVFTAPIGTYSLTNFENSDKYDTSSLSYIMCAGTPMCPSQLTKVRQTFKDTYVGLCYGMSEVGLVAVTHPARDPSENNKNLSSCGIPAPALKLKVVDLDTEQLLGPHQNGEIRVSALSLMKGYHKLDCSHVFDNDAFLKTGDVGYYDDNGCVYMVERIREMFKYQGWHIVPTAVETVLLENDGIAEVVVYGIPAGEDGEVPAASIVLKEGCKLTEEDIHAFLNERVADRERLRGGVIFVASLPRTTTGKVARREVRDSVLSARNGSTK